MAIVKSQWLQGRVVRQYHWNERLLSLWIEVPQQPFKAGQFVKLQLPIEQEGEIKPLAKSYSLVNPPSETTVAEIFYNIVPNGRLSQALAQLQSGDTIEVSQPANGFFVLDEVPQAEHLWMIATGTGLGPYLSILRTAEVWQRFNKIVLVQSVPLQSELAYSELIANLQAQYPEQFKWVSSVTREPNPAGLSERVTTALQSGRLEQVAGLEIDPANTHVMLCGNHAMLDEMKALLGERGLQRHLRHKPGHITTEQYF
ncbi:ferredoxin--NADP reductase [Thiofilum flexile]|uniref:ferredoxin--NADP reductase n=1 Tax=Thiofilum flexile TaxID=125627 RepID=UPI00038205AE|nr:ferredoxin--NADP reductase [Thiofilum flexile]